MPTWWRSHREKETVHGYHPACSPARPDPGRAGVRDSHPVVDRAHRAGDLACRVRRARGRGRIAGPLVPLVIGPPRIAPGLACAGLRLTRLTGSGVAPRAATRSGLGGG